MPELTPQKPDGLLDGFCPEPRQDEQIAVNANGLMLFLSLADIECMEAADNCVELRVGQETHRLRETLAAVAAKLPPGRFLRINCSTLVNIEQIKELRPTFNGQYEVRLRNGTRLTFTRGYAGYLRQTGVSLLPSIKPLACSRSFRTGEPHPHRVAVKRW